MTRQRLRRLMLQPAAGGALDGSESDGTQLLETGAGPGDKDFATGWTAQNSLTLTPNAVLAPDGTTTAASFFGANSTGNFRAYADRNGGTTPYNNFTFSLYVKAVTKQYFKVIVYDPAGYVDSFYGTFDMSGLTWTETGGSGVGSVLSGVSAAGANSFRKITLNGNFSTTKQAVEIFLMCADSATPGGGAATTWASNGSNGAYIWRPKLTGS